MKKSIISLLLTIFLSGPSVGIFAGSGDTAAGVAAGLVGGALITGIASSSSRRSSRAEEEARRAQEQTEQLRREQQHEKISQLQKNLTQEQSSRTVNMLIFAIAILFLGIIGLGILVLKKK